MLTLHGSDVNVFPHVSHLNKTSFATAARDADVLVAVSEALSDRAHLLCGKRALVMPIGINLRAYDTLPDKASARKALGLSLEATVVLYVGNLVVEKGIRELLESLGTLLGRNTLGVFVGDGPLRLEAQRHAMTRVDGPQPNERIPVYLAASDLFVLPSYSEGMPTVLIEAGAAGLPILSTAVGGVPELLGNGRGLLVAAKSREAIVDGVRQVLADRRQAQSRADRLREYVWTHYDADRNAARMAELYASLLGTRRAVSACKGLAAPIREGASVIGEAPCSRLKRPDDR